MRKILTREMNRVVAFERRYGRAIQFLIIVIGAFAGVVAAIAATLRYLGVL